MKWNIFNVCIYIITIILFPINSIAYSNENKINLKDLPKKNNEKELINKNFFYDSDEYILDKGDSLSIVFNGVPELSGVFNIDVDGTIYLPRLKMLKISGFTIPKLENYLENKYKEYIINPELTITISTYRPIRVYVGGEVSRPGYYTLSNYQRTTNQQKKFERTDDLDLTFKPSETFKYINEPISQNFPLFFPTVFDAIQEAEGITPFSDISNIKITRKIPLNKGGGRKTANIDFLSLILDGDDSQNIRLYDGDTIFIERGDNVFIEKIIKAGQTNLNPRFINIYLSGRVLEPGKLQIPTGATLNNAIAVAGGTKLLKGKVEFIRFTNEGKIDRRKFKYSPKAGANNYKNPILKNGDIVRVRDSIITSSLGVVTEVTSPLVNVFSVYGFFDTFFED